MEAGDSWVTSKAAKLSVGRIGGGSVMPWVKLVAVDMYEVVRVHRIRCNSCVPGAIFDDYQPRVGRNMLAEDSRGGPVLYVGRTVLRA